MILSSPPSSNTKCNRIIICLSAAIVLIFWGTKVHQPTSQANTMAPHRVSVVLSSCLLLYLSLNFALWEHPRDRVLCRPQRRVEVKCPLKLRKVILVCSNYIPHTFNPCVVVTMLYLLCQLTIAPAQLSVSWGEPGNETKLILNWKFTPDLLPFLVNVNFRYTVIVVV